MKRKKSRVYTALLVTLILTWIALMVSWIVLQMTFKGKNNLSGWGDFYYEDWDWVEEDGTRKRIDLPAEFDDSVGNLAVIEKTLPDEIPGDAVFALLSRKNTAVYVGGEQRFITVNDDVMVVGQRMKMRQYQVPLSPEDAGKTLRVEFWGETTQNGQIDRVFYGNTYGIYRAIMKHEGWMVYVVIPLLLFSLLLIPVGYILYRLFKSGYSISFLAIGIATIVSWIVCDNVIYQYLFTTYDIDGILSFLFSMLIPFPFACYLNIEQKKRYQKWLTGVLAFNIVYFAVVAILHFTDVATFRDTMGYMNLMLGLAILAELGTVVVDHFKGHSKEYYLVTVGICGMAGFGILELVSLNFFSINAMSEIFTVLGLYFLVLMALLNMLRQVRVVKLRAQDALRASEYKSGFLANMSHEIRTPINAILGMNTMILREAENEEIREYATNVENAGRTLLSLVNEILDISKIESGKMELVEENFKLNDLLQEVIPLIRIKTDEKNLLFKVDVDSELPAVLYGDEGRIRQIMLNILNNAVKYTDKGSILFKVFGVTGEDYRLEFDVADTGKGIRDEAQATLFDAFKRVDEKSNKNIEGTGLGLSIAKNFVDMMGGDISVESHYGKGSIFHVEIPVKSKSEDVIGRFIPNQIPIVKKQVNKGIFVAPSRTALIVDDMVVNQKVFCALLKRTKMQIDCASSGQECLEMVKQKRYDIIFLDHMMPGMDGIQTFRAMKQDAENKCWDVPVIMLTANAIVGSKERYIQEGFSDYLTKPISGDKLEELLHHFLGDEESGNIETVTPVDLLNVGRNELPYLKEFDLEYAMTNMQDKQLLLRILENAADNLSILNDELLRAYDKLPEETQLPDGGDMLNEYGAKVRAIVKCAETIGALLLAKVARLSELAVDAGNIERARYIHPLLVEEIYSHIQILRSEYSK